MDKKGKVVATVIGREGAKTYMSLDFWHKKTSSKDYANNVAPAASKKKSKKKKKWNLLACSERHTK